MIKFRKKNLICKNNNQLPRPKKLRHENPNAQCVKGIIAGTGEFNTEEINFELFLDSTLPHKIYKLWLLFIYFV